MTAKEFNYQVNEFTHDLRPHAMRFAKNEEKANDLIQDTIYKALSNRHRFRLGTNLKAWLYTIMKNTFITGYQKKSRRNEFVDNTQNQHYINDLNNTIENYGENKFVLNDIQKALDNLEDTFKTPFMMYFRGFKYLEIADKLDIPIGTVKNRIHIARKELKSDLDDYSLAK